MQVATRAHAMGAIVAAAGVLLLGAGDVYRGAPHLFLVLSARAIWAAALLLIAAHTLRGGGRPITVPAAIAVVASVAALAALVWADGFSGSGSAAYLVTAPLFVAILVPDARVAAVGAVASLAGTVAVGAAVGLPPARVAAVAIRSAFAGAFAIFGCLLQERARRSELGLAEERARAMEALAASERRRAEAEPLAVAGSRAAAVAHDMSGSISALRVNLGWLDEALRDGRVAARDPETASVLHDARASAEALLRAVGDLRREALAARRAGAAAGGTGAPPPPSRASGE